MSAPEPRLATIGLVRGSGFAPWVIRTVTRSPYAHAILYVGDGEIVEAEPSGARKVPLRYTEVYWCENLSDLLDDAQREGAAAWAVGQTRTNGGRGTPYSWIDDGEIGFVDLFDWAPGWMRRRLASTATLQCAQLCDTAYLQQGAHLFTDGRPAGGVSPGALWRLDRAT